MIDFADMRGWPLRCGRTVAIAPLLAAVAAAVAGLVVDAVPAQAQRMENKVAVFAALDKVTARISRRRVPLGSTDQFGSLKVTPRVCYSRPPDEQPKTSTFVDVQEVLLDGNTKQLFSGWMFAESPGLHAVEHPVFDVWLIGCEEPVNVAASAQPGNRSATGRGGEQPAERVRRRVRR